MSFITFYLLKFSELKNLVEKRETEFAQVSEVLEKSKTLESEFDFTAAGPSL